MDLFLSNRHRAAQLVCRAASGLLRHLKTAPTLPGNFNIPLSLGVRHPTDRRTDRAMLPPSLPLQNDANHKSVLRAQHISTPGCRQAEQITVQPVRQPSTRFDGQPEQASRTGHLMDDELALFLMRLSSLALPLLCAIARLAAVIACQAESCFRIGFIKRCYHQPRRPEDDALSLAEAAVRG